jgi:hypothetical protein
VTEPPAPDEQTSDATRDTTDAEPPRELPPPRFNPIYFGIVAATIQMALLLWLWYG